MNGWEAIHTNVFKEVSLSAFCLVCLSLWLLAGCLEQPQLAGISNLRQVQTFGNVDGDGMLSGISLFATDHNEYLYVADQLASRIVQFTADGEFVRAVGRNGRGPGEFATHLIVEATEGYFCVIDSNNLRISCFDNQGELISIFPIEHTHMGEMALAQNRIILGPEAGKFQPINPDNDDRFHLFDLEGNKLNSFGSFLETGGDKNLAVISMAHLKINNGRLHVAYIYFPIYQIYDLESGELLAEHILEDLVSSEETEPNRELSREDLFSLDTRVVFAATGLQVVEGRVFIQTSNSHDTVFTVREYALDGTDLEYHRSYRYVTAEGGVAAIRDFLFFPSRNSFYLSEATNSSGPRIAEYEVIEEIEEE